MTSKNGSERSWPTNEETSPDITMDLRQNSTTTVMIEGTKSTGIVKLPFLGAALLFLAKKKISPDYIKKAAEKFFNQHKEWPSQRNLAELAGTTRHQSAKVL
ncbi:MULTISPECIES: hypothetical protein [Thermoactinomyces]|uniref:Uncharacterized protein n=1 Tax=Thermoactinomyces daqus TaxID=1329516 RepID=A0A7W1XCW0_9BACL|nr:MULTISPECIES: hypothetical protein [Thermoactinomyces]MBA4544339.1 hypothetical protein [Thermoactinomyces daqus]MBH8599261.1 hypothetical protein [Thermoactinomyces sp. CICC 10523]MBH8608726.1 hypothetical protein [Thermoactinomyces sp. CICC 10521]